MSDNIIGFLRTVDHNPGIFFSEAERIGAKEFELTMRYEEANNGVVVCSYERRATAPDGSRIRSERKQIHHLFYHNQWVGHYLVVPNIAGQALKLIGERDEHYQERVVAAFLLANHQKAEYLGETVTKTMIRGDERTINREGLGYIVGEQCGNALEPMDTEMLNQCFGKPNSPEKSYPPLRLVQ